MNNKKVKSLVAAIVIGTTLLTGCSSDKAPVVEDTAAMETTEPTISVTVGTNRIDIFEEQPEAKEFEAGEHIYMSRYHVRRSIGVENVSGVSITVPEGYQVLDFENYISLGGKIGTQQTYGVDVWFINDEKVLVKPVFNEGLGAYDYSQAGTVILEEKVEKELTK